MRLAPLLMLLPLAAAADEPRFTPEQVRFYETEVRPLLQKHCFKCHGEDPHKLRGQLNLTKRASILQGGESGPAVNLEQPEKSLLLLAITNKRPDGGDVMPPSGQLANDDIAILSRWVEQQLPVSEADRGEQAGAKPPGKPPLINEEARAWWAFQPIIKPSVPEGTHPVDYFLDLQLKQRGLVPNGPAEKRVLARRAYYDLLGLPPTPEQLDAFLRNESPQAFEQLIDDLLASPHYGERWARHWLDVVRYAETNGYERDGPKPLAWKYRDYVIRSFNADKPYDQFLREQLAGDELPDWHPDHIIATGFYRLGLWDDEPADPLLALYDGYDDIATTVSQGMLGLSLNCARCHDHKRDPLSQADYYRFIAFFRDITPFSETRDVRSPNNMADITPPAKRQQYEAELAERNNQIERLCARMKPIEDAAIRKMPPEDQLAVDDGKREQILHKVPQFLEAEQRQQYERWQRRLDDLRRRPMPSQEFALAVARCLPNPPDTYVLARGNPHAPKLNERCPPGFPAVLGVPDPGCTPRAKSSGRRSALAHWITAPTNPLTPRVIVNRIWQYHFGRGIVPTPNDFGKLGEPPSHPFLLDWLAADFIQHGWTIKRMHRIIMTSQAYRRSALANTANLTADPANTAYWRYSMRRLTAEEIRDSMLAVAGKLDLRQFGESVYPKIPDEVLQGQSMPGNGWERGKGGGYDPARPDAGNRRTIYVHLKRSLQLPILALHDQADTDASCPVRHTTTVPTQALGLLNGEFTHTMAAAMARRLAHDAGPDPAQQITRGIRLATGREPTTEELTRDLEFLHRLQTEHGRTPLEALERFCLLLLNSNEFVYLD